MSKTEDLDDYKDAYGDDFKFTDENLGMLGAYADRMCRQLTRTGPIRLLSLGIGHNIVSRTIQQALGDKLKEYVIVEGSEVMISRYKEAESLPANVNVVQSWFEEYTPSEKFDVIEMGFVLEHVDDPAQIVGRFKNFLKPGGTLFMAVPNARSLHRLIGHNAGLLDNLYRLSEHDLQLGHKRYFDCESFTQLALNNGLKVVSVEGLFLKPVTTSQLTSLNLPDQVWQALYSGGAEFPAISNAILIEATV